MARVEWLLKFITHLPLCEALSFGIVEKFHQFIHSYCLYSITMHLLILTLQHIYTLSICCLMTADILFLLFYITCWVRDEVLSNFRKYDFSYSLHISLN